MVPRGVVAKEDLMALRECPECKKQVSDQATACPGCGVKLKPKQKLTLKHYIILAVAVLIGIGILQSRHPSTGPKPGEQDAATKAAGGDRDMERFRKRVEKQMAAGDVVATSAARMYSDYNSNEVAADAKYKGKWVQVKGRVGSVAKDLTGDPYLVLPADEYGVAQARADLFPVQIKEFRGKNDFTVCTALEKAGALKSGQAVTVECLGRGTVIGMPQLEQCVIVDAK